MFLAAFGFLAAVVFLPRWFQVVTGASATVSGYGMRRILSRTGRHRTLILGSLVVLAAGLAMLTQLRVDTPLPLPWAWMFVTGIGMGPVFSVFALVVVSSVPVTQIGAATSNLSLFQQVGGTVGLAITGTMVATSLGTELPSSMARADVLGALASAGAGGAGALTGVGNAGASLLVSLPPDPRALVEPFLPQIAGAVHEAFSIATAFPRPRQRMQPAAPVSCS